MEVEAECSTTKDYFEVIISNKKNVTKTFSFSMNDLLEEDEELKFRHKQFGNFWTPQILNKVWESMSLPSREYITKFIIFFPIPTEGLYEDIVEAEGESMDVGISDQLLEVLSSYGNEDVVASNYFLFIYFNHLLYRSLHPLRSMLKLSSYDENIYHALVRMMKSKRKKLKLEDYFKDEKGRLKIALMKEVLT